jgi:hypothetical protein
MTKTTEKVDPKTLRTSAKLNMMADLLERVPEERFRMCNWTSSTGSRRASANPNPRCGTTHCVAGWGTALFKDFTIKDGYPEYGELGDQEAFAEVIGITGDESYDICYTYGRTKAAAVKWLRKCAARYEKREAAAK